MTKKMPPRSGRAPSRQNTAPPLGLTISELARRSGVSISTIKYYVREGLLPAGDLAATRRQYYDQRHLDRLAVIRALRDVGEIPVDGVRRLAAILDRGQMPTLELVSMAIDVLGPRRRRRESAPERVAKRQLYRFLRARRLRVRRDSGALRDLAVSVATLRRFNPDLAVEHLTPYVELTLQLAKREVSANAQKLQMSPQRALTVAILGTVLWEPVILATRRLASEHVATGLFQRRRAS